MKRIILGTANLNIKYGISNYKHKQKYFDKKITKQILDNKIKFIDTSPNYRLKYHNNNFEKFEVITKINLPKKNIKSFIKNLEVSIKMDLKKNNKKNFYAILLHNPKDLYSKNSQIFLKKLFLLKKKKYFKKIGVSIYNPKELKKICAVFKPEIVQFPINIFDQRMINESAINFLKKKKIETQARSIFLQGLLLKNLKFLKKIVNKDMFNKLSNFKKWCDNRKISRLDACVDFVKQNKKIDYITIGFENLNQIKEVINSFKKNLNINYSELNIKDQKIIDPRKW